MEAKKISFGFSKINKKVNLLQAGPSAIGSAKQRNDGEKIELISCLEGQSIKIIGKENGDSEPPPLVIPLREQDKTTIPDRLARLQDIIEGRDPEENSSKQDEEATEAPVGGETLEQRAAREILEDLKERKSRGNEINSMVVPLKPEDLPLDGGRESTIDEYESVPIEKFGLAMLRGMGWKDDPNAPKKDNKIPEGPVQRPKGMGLGAERVPKDKNQQLIPPAKDEVLTMKKGAFVKVLAGKHKESYGTHRRNMGEETPIQTTEQPPQTKKEVTSVETVKEEVKPTAEVEAVALSLVNDTVEESTQEAAPEASSAVPMAEVQPEVTSTVAQDAAAPSITYEKRADGMPQFMYDAVARMAPQEGFTPGQFQISFESGSGKGDGFVAEMFRASITEGDRKLVVLCKIPPINDARRQQFGSMPIFDREVQAYSSFLPIMYEFQREKGVTEEMGTGFFNVPQCYLAYIDGPKEESVIIMDDLRLKDYRMWNKLVPVNYEHAKLLMIQLGRLHAVSLALKDQRPDIFEQFKVPDPLISMMKGNVGFTFMMQSSLDRAMTVLEPHEEKARQKLSKLKETLFDDLATLTSSEYAEPYAVLAHGDCWINNMIYSYKVESLDEENARVVIRFSIGGNQESLNEYLLQLVSNAEYKKYSKVLNNAKYEEFKNRTPGTVAIKEEKTDDRKIIKREPSDSPTPPRPTSSSRSQSSRSNRDYDQQRDRKDRSPVPRAEDRHNRRDRHDRKDLVEKEHRRRRERRSRSTEDRRHDRRRGAASSSDDASDSDESDERDRGRQLLQHKSSSSSSYARTSSGTKKKSHKYKQRRDHSRERVHSSDEDDRRHKKKTKKSKKQRSRSRSRR